MTKEQDIQIIVNKLIEIIYEMYLKDLKSGNIVKEPLKYFGKICKKRGALRKNEEPNLFSY